MEKSPSLKLFLSLLRAFRLFYRDFTAFFAIFDSLHHYGSQQPHVPALNHPISDKLESE